MSGPVYMAVEFWSRDTSDQNPQLIANVIATAEELIQHRKDYRGCEHRITGFYSAEEAAAFSLNERGFADLEEEMNPHITAKVAIYNHLREEANRIAAEIEAEGYEGFYITPQGKKGKLLVDTRPTEFVFQKVES